MKQTLLRLFDRKWFCQVHNLTYVSVRKLAENGTALVCSWVFEPSTSVFKSSTAIRVCSKSTKEGRVKRAGNERWVAIRWPCCYVGYELKPEP